MIANKIIIKNNKYLFEAFRKVGNFAAVFEYTELVNIIIHPIKLYI